MYINGDLVPRNEAKVSVWDSGFQSGDGVYEGIRIYHGKIFRLQEHIDRLYRCASAIGIDLPMSQDDMCASVLETVRANGLTHEAHIRLTVTRGLKSQTGMNPRLVCSDSPTVVIIVEPKKPTFPKSGIALVTSSVRRMPADALDPKLHTINQLGQILAKFEANNAGADEALMLDHSGFVAETNSANLFIVAGGRVVTPTRKACMPGLTRGFLLQLAAQMGYETREEDISLSDVYMADEAFICGTICEVVPVVRVDGRSIGGGQPGPVTGALSRAYLEVATTAGVPVG